MGGPHSDGLCAAAYSKVDGLRLGSGEWGGVVVAELAGRVVSPTLNAVVVQQRASVKLTRCDGLGAAARPKVDRVRRRRVAACGVAFSELAALVVSPAFDAVVVQDRAGMG